MEPQVLQNRILREFETIVADLRQSQETLVRFLVARDYDLAEAEAMLRKSVEWHQARKNEVAGSKIDERIVNGFPHCFGLDFCNRVVMYLPVGSWPIREMLEAGLKKDMHQYVFVCWENLVAEIEKTSESQCTVLFDLQDLNYRTAIHWEAIQMAIQVFQQFCDNFPERLFEVLLINVPMIFNFGWGFVKPFLPSKTLTKFVFLGSNPKVYIEEILKRMPADALPENLVRKIQ